MRPRGFSPFALAAAARFSHTASLQPEATHVWGVYCAVKQWCCNAQPGLVNADGAVPATEERLRCESPDWQGEEIPLEDAKELFGWGYFHDTLGFLDMAKDTFSKAVDQLTG